MKILVLSTCYPRRRFPHHGIFIHRQVRALADLGAECHVLQPVDWAPWPPLDRLHPGWKSASASRADMLSEVDSIPVHHPVVYHPKPSRFFPGDYWERVGNAVARYVERRESLRSADLMYAQFLCHEGYAGLLATRRLGMSLVAIAFGDDVHAWPARWPDRKPKLAAVLSQAEGLLACSAGLARDAESWATAGLSRPVEVVYTGVDTRRFSPRDATEREEVRDRLGLPRGRRLLLSVATPIAAKGWNDLLDAFAALGEEAPEWDLVAAGTPRGPDDLDLTAEATKRACGHRFRWVGTIHPERMPDLYRAVDAFVLASHNEGLANSVLEAMASGLVVVATRVGGHAEIIEDGVSGRLVPPLQPERLRDVLREVLTNRTLGTAMGQAARGRATAVGDHHANAAQLLGFLEETIRRAGSRSARALAPATLNESMADVRNPGSPE